MLKIKLPSIECDFSKFQTRLLEQNQSCDILKTYKCTVVRAFMVTSAFIWRWKSLFLQDEAHSVCKAVAGFFLVDNCSPWTILIFLLTNTYCSLPLWMFSMAAYHFNLNSNQFLKKTLPNSTFLVIGRK